MPQLKGLVIKSFNSGHFFHRHAFHSMKNDVVNTLRCEHRSEHNNNNNEKCKRICACIVWMWFDYGVLSRFVCAIQMGEMASASMYGHGHVVQFFQTALQDIHFPPALVFISLLVHLFVRFYSPFSFSFTLSLTFSRKKNHRLTGTQQINFLKMDRIYPPQPSLFLILFMSKQVERTFHLALVQIWSLGRDI